MNINSCLKKIILNKKKIFTLLLIILSTNLSCNFEKKDIPREILYWSSNNNEEISFARFITNEWNKRNLELKVHFQPVPEGQSSEEIILAAVVGKTTPDVYSNMWQGDVETYAQAGVLVALDTLNGFIQFLNERCDSWTVKEVTSKDGHIYQIPWKINPIMMIYNKKILKELGLTSPPQTYSEFLEAAKRFKKDNNNDGYTDQWIGYTEVHTTWWQRLFDFYPLYLAASNGASLIQNDKAVFNNVHALQVFEFLRELYKKEYFPKERISARQDPFLSSTIATRFTGPWEISHAEKFKPTDFEYSFQTMPVPNEHSGPIFTYGDPKNIIVFKSSVDPNKILKFLKYFLSEENDLKLIEMTNQLPRRKNIDKNPVFANYFTKNPLMLRFAHQANYVKGTDVSVILKEVFDIISQEYEACVIYGVKTPKEALKDAERAVNLLFIK
ncbi:MAG: extracellular solute-binding protein [Ignavibacteriaceae bacterium]|nr:extracellular solute-binding protein [Ignavibacteriaceae bacterium]